MSPNNTTCNEMNHSIVGKCKLDYFSLNRNSSSSHEREIVKRMNKLGKHQNLLLKKKRMAQLLLSNNCCKEF
jgi:hypothetical protein